MHVARHLTLKPYSADEWLCYTNCVKDTSCKAIVVAEMYEQTYTPNLQDQQLASL